MGAAPALWGVFTSPIIGFDVYPAVAVLFFEWYYYIATLTSWIFPMSFPANLWFPYAYMQASLHHLTDNTSKLWCWRQQRQKSLDVRLKMWVQAHVNTIDTWVSVLARIKGNYIVCNYTEMWAGGVKGRFSGASSYGNLIWFIWPFQHSGCFFLNLASHFLDGLFVDSTVLM